MKSRITLRIGKILEALTAPVEERGRGTKITVHVSERGNGGEEAAWGEGGPEGVSAFCRCGENEGSNSGGSKKGEGEERKCAIGREQSQAALAEVVVAGAGRWRLVELGASPRCLPLAFSPAFGGTVGGGEPWH